VKDLDVPGEHPEELHAPVQVLINSRRMLLWGTGASHEFHT